MHQDYRFVALVELLQNLCRRCASAADRWPNEQDFSHDTLFLFGKTL